MIRQGGKETGLRYLSCSLCACEWHYVRIKCSHCEESKHLAYLSLEHDGQPAEKPCCAETRPSCQGYLKQFYLEFDRHADALADDLASLALDMRLAEDGPAAFAEPVAGPGGDSRRRCGHAPTRL